MAITKVTTVKPYYTLDDETMTVSVTFKATKNATSCSITMGSQEQFPFNIDGSIRYLNYQPFESKTVSKSITASSTYTVTFTLDRANYTMYHEQMPNDRSVGAGVMFFTTYNSSGTQMDSFSYHASSGTTPVVYFGVSRIAPVVTASTLSDSAEYNDTSAYDRYGIFVQKRSSVAFEGNATLDTRDPVAQLTHSLTVKNSNGATVYTKNQVNDNEFDMGTVNENGTYSYTYSITDEYDNIGSYNGTFSVAPYSIPTLVKRNNVDFVERIAQHIVGEETVWETDEMGNDVWLNYVATVSQISGNSNPWTVVVRYRKEDEPTNITSVTVNNYDGTDTFTYTANNWEQALGTVGHFQSSKGWVFDITLKDWFNVPVTISSILIEEASAYFDVEPYGVAVGKMSEGTTDNPLFESAYPAKLYGGMLNIQSGVVEFGTISANGSKNITVTFEHEFAEAPVVLMNPFASSSSNSAVAKMPVHAGNDSVTGSGFTARCVNGDSTSHTMKGVWVAFGIPT